MHDCDILTMTNLYLFFIEFDEKFTKFEVVDGLVKAVGTMEHDIYFLFLNLKLYIVYLSNAISIVFLEREVDQNFLNSRVVVGQVKDSGT